MLEVVSFTCGVRVDFLIFDRSNFLVFVFRLVLEVRVLNGLSGKSLRVYLSVMGIAEARCSCNVVKVAPDKK